MQNFHKRRNFNQEPNSPTAQQNKPNSKWLFSFCLIFLFAISPQAANAQCTIHAADFGNGTTFNGSGPQLGQTFLACDNGDITSISVGFHSITSTGTYELYLGVDPGSGSYLPATAVATLSIPSPLVGNQILTFTLGTPFPVLNDGTLYRFAIGKNPTAASQAIRLRRSFPSDYTDGQNVNSAGNHSNLDLDFEITQAPSSNPSVPTLSEWGLLILALLLMTLGTLYLLQPKFRGPFGFEQK